MSNGLAKQGKVKNALERLDVVEATLSTMQGDLSTIEQFINGDKQNREVRFAALVELVEGIVDAFGRDKVEAILADKRAKKDAERIVAADKKIDEMLLNGELKTTEEVSEKSLVVGTETEKETGKAIPPGKFYVDFPNFFPETQVLMLGKKAGDSVAAANGNTISIIAVYERVPKEEPKADAPAADTKAEG